MPPAWGPVKGGPEVLTPTTRPVPEPGHGEILIAVDHAGVNRPDALQRAGAYNPPPGASDLPGLEAAGRVAAIAIQLSGQGGGGVGKSVVVRGPDIRRVLRPTTGRLLLSAQFSLTAERRDGRVRQLAVDGAGAGHGVGFCQWGAVGRARAGQEYDEILAAYFPRTVLERLE